MSFTHSERAIFSFSLPDGKVRYEDPLVILRGLTLFTKGRLDELIKKQGITDTDNTLDPIIRAEAEDQLIVAVRNAFKPLPPIDQSTGEGITDSFCIDLLQQFIDWVDAKKASTGD